MKKVTGLLALAAMLVCGQTVSAQGWATIKGKIVVEGDAPKFANLVKKGDANVKDSNVCAVESIPDEKLIVGPKGGLANCFVYLYQRRGTPDIHPALKKPAQAKVTFDQKGCRFLPHVMVVRTDQKVNCISNDGCGHNVHTFPIKNKAINQVIAPNDKKGIDVEFTKGESLPMSVVCDIHPWMTAKWLVVDHPYAVVSDIDGSFEINMIPAGEHKFRIWHEIPGYIKRDGERYIEVDLKANQVLDLGVIKVAADSLKE